MNHELTTFQSYILLGLTWAAKSYRATTYCGAGLGFGFALGIGGGGLLAPVDDDVVLELAGEYGGGAAEAAANDDDDGGGGGAFLKPPALGGGTRVTALEEDGKRARVEEGPPGVRPFS